MSWDPGERKGYGVAVAIAALLVVDAILFGLLLTRNSDRDGSSVPVAGSAATSDATASDTPGGNRSSEPSAPTSPAPSTSNPPTRSPSAPPSPSQSRTVSPFVFSSPSQATAPLQLRLTTPSATPSSAVPVRGRYQGAAPGTRLVVERQRGDRWVAFPLQPATLAGGRFRTFVALVEPGSYRVRVRDPQRDVTSEVEVLRIE